jgi:bacterioferritin-associated ferredoxin
MIVCHCHVVSDRRIRAEIESGACTDEDVAFRCGAGARCGACRPAIGALLAVHARVPTVTTIATVSGYAIADAEQPAA